MKPEIFKPPGLATKLLNWLADPNTKEEVQGDLLEMYAYWVQRYIWSVFKLARPFAKDKKAAKYQPTYLYMDPVKSLRSG